MNEGAYRAILKRLGVEPPARRAAQSGGDPELARRVAAFRRQLEAWTPSGRPGVPLLTLPDAPTPLLRHCVSCGEPIPEDCWRCELCLRAVELALGLERRRSEGEAP